MSPNISASFSSRALRAAAISSSLLVVMVEAIRSRSMGAAAPDSALAPDELC
jgi:hypothetical protein